MAGVPQQLLVLQRLTELLEGINRATTDPNTGTFYTYDLNGKVFRGKSEIGTQVQGPFLSLLEATVLEEELFAGEGKKKAIGPWKLLLQGFIEADKDPRAALDPAYVFRAQCQQRLARVIAEKDDGRGPEYPDVYRLGGLIAGLRIYRGVVRPPESGVSSMAFFYVPLVVELATDITKPYVDVP